MVRPAREWKGRRWRYLVNVAEDGLLDGLVLDDLTEHTTVTTTDDQDLLGVGVGVHGEVSDHLLVAMDGVVREGFISQ